MRRTNTKVLICLPVVSLLVACGSKSSDKAKDEDNKTVTGTGTSTDSPEATKLAAVDDVSDLKLGSAFSLNLPDALEGSGGASLALTAAKRSQEACQMGSTIKEVTSRLSEVGNFFCHIEVEKDKIEFGKKYKITFGGQEFGRIYIDNSEVASGKITLGFCGKGEEQSSQLITISGISDTGPKGSILTNGSGSFEGQAQTWTGAYSFDMSTAGTAKMEAGERFTHSTNEFVRSVVLELLDSGVSTAALASKGTWGGQAFQDRGAAKFDGTHGSSLFQSSGSHEGSVYQFTRRAHFDAEGLVVSGTASTEFASGGALYIGKADVPAFLASDFTPASATGWVGGGCADVDAEVELNPDSVEHQQCDSDRDDEHVECWDENTFESGASDTTLD